ncbi:MAG: hypothetical protein WC588_04510 [Candidatus Micrarchaeia archaeon]
MTLNFAPAHLKAVPLRSVLDLPTGYFGGKDAKVGNPGLTPMTFSRFCPLLSNGWVMPYSEFAALKREDPQAAARLVNEVVGQSGILVLGTYIFNMPPNAQGDLHYTNNGVYYGVQMPPEISSLLGAGPVAMDFLKGAISFNLKNTNAVWAYLSVSEEAKKAIYTAPAKGVPETYFGLAAINYLPTYDRRLVPHYGAFQSGPIGLDKASVIVKAK